VAKGTDEAVIASGKQELRLAGVNLESGPGELPGLLRKQIGRSPQVDLAIADLLGAVATEEAGAVLVELEGKASKREDKTVAKAARRALYRISQRGVPIPARRIPDELPVHKGLAPEVEGFATAIDAAGGRLVLLARPRTGSLLVLTAALNEPLGMEAVSLSETTRKQLRSFREESAEQHGLNLIEADWRYLDALCHQAFERARSRGVKDIASYPSLRRQITTSPPDTLDEPFICRLLDCQAVAQNPACLARSGRLFDEPEIANWILPPEMRENYGGQMRKITDSPIVLSRLQKEERAEEIIQKCMREVCSEPVRDLYARRLEEMAYYFLQTGRKSQAEAAVAAAAAFRQGGRDPAEIAFWEQLVRRTLGFLLLEDEMREREEAASSVLIRPGAAGPASSSPLVLPGAKADKG